MAAVERMERFRFAAQGYLNSEEFSDFTIVCEEKEFKVHRCFIAAHSPFFRSCCTGLFEETKASRVDLKDDLKEVVEKMITFFYTFDYDDTVTTEPRPHIRSGRPGMAIQMNAHVYALAEKYKIDDLKALALEKFKKRADISSRPTMLCATWTVFKCIHLPDNDTKLSNLVINMWILGAPDWFEGKGNQTLLNFAKDMPEVIYTIFAKVMEALKGGTVRRGCERCHHQEIILRAKAIEGGFRCKFCEGTEAEVPITIQGPVPVNKDW